MPVCDSCGADVDVGSRFCGECGAVVDVEGEGARAGGKAKSIQAKKSRELKQRAVIPARSGETRLPASPAPATQLAPKDPKELRSTIRGVSAPPPALGLIVPPPKAASTPPAPPAPVVAKPSSPPTDLESLPPVLQFTGSAPPELPTSATQPPTAPPSSPGQRSDFQRLLDEVESGFEEILVTNRPDEEVAPPPPRAPSLPPLEGAPTAENEFDQEQARQLFSELVVANAQPIRDFMIEVRLGEPHRAWLDACEPAIAAILRSAEGMGMTELVMKLRAFLVKLGAARVDAEPIVRGDARERLIDAYSDLIVFFPEAFALETESNRREAVIVTALLSKVPGLHRLGADRIHATGMASLGLFYVSRPQEIAELGGVSLEVAERVIERFRAYRRESSELSPVKGRLAERTLLARATDELERANAAYDHAPPVSAERRVHRRERALVMADIAVLLARLGQVERLEKIETQAFTARVEGLRACVEELERRANAESRVR
ncbi:MAG: zinc ribbon domain-containing protein [Polyangiaceae bacterium]